ncbi:hypothetical protein DFH06DRAFT_1486334 [Mycena polygramma]|nr:hypothetical protein DFH06DRAFT_1486334 [Mycena polygramma]
MAAPVSSLVYQYALAGAVGLIALIVFALCLRARVLERRRARNAPLTSALSDLEKKPRLYDAYLDDSGTGELWHEIMPVSSHPVGPPSTNPSKNVPIDTNPLMSTLSTVALLIAMPAPSHNPPSRDPESGPDLPHLEIGVADVEVART